MKARVFLAGFLVGIFDRLQQIAVIAPAQQFPDRHQLPFPGAVRTDAAGKVHFPAEFFIQRQLIEPGFGHGDQQPGKVKQCMRLTLALAFTDFKHIIFRRGFVHTGFSSSVLNPSGAKSLKDIQQI